MNQDRLELTVGHAVQLVAAVTPSDAKTKTVNWSSDNRFVADVDKDGNVEIVSKNFTMTTSQQPKKEAEASEWTCWGCGHVNSGEVCEVCGKKRVQK